MESCKTCKFYLLSDAEHIDADVVFARCRRFPPVYVGKDEGCDVFEFPNICSDEWCGEYKPR